MIFSDNINIAFNGSAILILLGTILLILYSFYIYKYTIPKIGSRLRYILIFLRAITIVSILLLIFEPLLKIKSSDTFEPANYLFIDNSASLAVKDSSSRIDKVTNFQKDFRKNIPTSVKEFTFGISPKEYNYTDKINFSEPLTNFSKIFQLVKQSKNISTITIVSDGIITDGYEPIYDAEKLGLPVFTIGVGDTSRIKDVFIKEVLYNQNIYAEEPTKIEAEIVNLGYENYPLRVSLFEENKLIQTNEIVLSPTGINKINFEYTPTKSGERKMRVSASILNKESNTSNNLYSFYLNVLKNKIKLVVISGSPSPDLSAIISSISPDKNIEIKKIVEVGENKFTEKINYSWIDSADVLFIIDFPRENTSAEFINRTFTAIKNFKPFFILATPTIAFDKLKQVESFLPFSINDISKETTQVQAELVPSNFNTIFSGLKAQQNIWATLPPLVKSNSITPPKSESLVLLKAINKNLPSTSPLLLSRSIGKQRSISFLAGDIWRWQLSTAERNQLFFQNFINDIVKWLNISDNKKQFIVRTTKQIYNVGETVEFNAELYDQTFKPINDADISLKIYNGTTSFEKKLIKVRDGLFNGSIENMSEGDFSFDAIAQVDGASIKSDLGRFSVITGTIEKYDTRMNIDFLKRISKSTGGKYFSIDDYDELWSELEKINDNSARRNYSFSEYPLWSNSWIILFIIILLSIEWLIRKKEGML